MKHEVHIDMKASSQSYLLCFVFQTLQKDIAFAFFTCTLAEKSHPHAMQVSAPQEQKKKKVIYDNRRWKNLEYHVTLLRKGPSVIIPFSFYTMFVLFYTYII